MSTRLHRGKSQIGAILNGEIRRPPDWEVVKGLILAFQQYATERDRLAQVSLRMGVEEFWRPRYTVIESAFRIPRPTTRHADAGQPPGYGPIPRQLPPAVRHFTGRTAELRLLTELIEQSADGTGTLVISAIGGMAGVGKTALAVQWAHRVADRFPDGQLYVNLRGYDTGPPTTAAQALAGFLSAFGVAGSDIPPQVEERAARYRTMVAGRRMLIVLDNAREVEQIRPLLPGTGRCAVVVTSRDSLAGLVAREGAHRLDLDLLSAADAHMLLRELIGARAVAEPQAGSALAARCGYLPLALRIAAELAISRPATPLADLVGELADRQQRLDLLDAGGDARTAVTAVFSWSIEHLPAETVRAFRLLGLHPGPDFDAYAAAALAGITPAQARRTLGALARAHLIHPTAADRYGMHDLLRAYAVKLATTQDSDVGRSDALQRLFDYYLAAAAAAMDRLYPAERHRRPRIGTPATPLPELADADAARRWLDAERCCMVTIAAHTTAYGWPSHAVRLSATVAGYLNDGHYAYALEVHGHAESAARQAGDVLSHAHAVLALGIAHLAAGDSGPATDHLRRALTLFRQADDRCDEGIVPTSLSRA